jgi:F0F1-type ATP synthase membrane subunit b/b'
MKKDDVDADLGAAPELTELREYFDVVDEEIAKITDGDLTDGLESILRAYATSGVPVEVVPEHVDATLAELSQCWDEQLAESTFDRADQALAQARRLHSDTVEIRDSIWTEVRQLRTELTQMSSRVAQLVESARAEATQLRAEAEAEREEARFLLKATRRDIQRLRALAGAERQVWRQAISEQLDEAQAQVQVILANAQQKAESILDDARRCAEMTLAEVEGRYAQSAEVNQDAGTARAVSVTSIGHNPGSGATPVLVIVTNVAAMVSVSANLASLAPAVIRVLHEDYSDEERSDAGAECHLWYPVSGLGPRPQLAPRANLLELTSGPVGRPPVLAVGNLFRDGHVDGRVFSFTGSSQPGEDESFEEANRAQPRHRA